MHDRSDLAQRLAPKPVWLLYLGLLCMPVCSALGADIPSASDACVEGMTETTPSTEFSEQEDGTVVRHERTSLEWRRCAEGQTWDANARICQGKPKSLTWNKAMKLGQQAGGEWRLPTGEELLTIVEQCHYSPAINPQVFPNTPGVLFWSSSVDTGGLDRVWSVSFFGGQYYRAGKTQNGRVRLVRGTLKAAGPP